MNLKNNSAQLNKNSGIINKIGVKIKLIKTGK